VVKILVGRGKVNPNQPDKGGRTPLWYAAGEGHEEVVRILLGWGEGSPDTLDWIGRTPLSYAFENGHE